MALASHFTIVRFVLILFAGWAALSACDSSSPAEEESPYATLANTTLAVSTVNTTSGKTSSVPLTDNFTITFSKAVQSLTATTSSGGSCSGSVQLSGDNFSNCEAATLS